MINEYMRVEDFNVLDVAIIGAVMCLLTGLLVRAYYREIIRELKGNK